MRNILLTIVCGLSVFSLAFFGNFLRGLYDENKELLSPIINLGGAQSPGPQPKNVLDLESDLRIVWVEVEDLSKISLYPNLVDHKTAKNLYKEKQCKTLVNGGFYSEDNKHIGALVSEGEVISEGSKNVLFKQVFKIDNDNIPSITPDFSDTNVRLAVQAGPILIEDGQSPVFKPASEGWERRTIVGITKENNVVFLMAYNPASAYLGPQIYNLPGILKSFGEKTGIEFVNALNLDGGTASAFYTEGVSLGELTKIGSYFCIR